MGKPRFVPLILTMDGRRVEATIRQLEARLGKLKIGDSQSSSRSRSSNPLNRVDPQTERAARAASNVTDRQLAAAQKADAKVLADMLKNAERTEKAKTQAAKTEAAKQLKAAEKLGKDKEKIDQQTARAAERIRAQEARAVASLQRQRSAALIAQAKEEIRILERSAKERERIAKQAARAEIKAAQEAQKAQEERQKRIPQGLSTAGNAAQTIGTGIMGIGGGLTGAITAPAVLAGKEILEQGVSYEKAMNVFRATTQATEEEMRRAAKAARDLGADTSLPATSAANAAQAMTELGKANFTASQSIDAARGVLQLAAAAQIDEAKAAEIAANAINSFKLEAKDSTKVADLLAAASNAASGEVTDIALAMQQSSAVFANAKVPIEDLVAGIGVMANAGIKGSDAGTSLKVMLQRLTAPTNKASQEMQALGVHTFDAQGKILPFRDIVVQFTEKLSKLNDQQKSQALYTVFGSDAMRAATVIFGQGTEAYDKMHKAVTRSGAAAELAAAKAKGLGGAWDALQSQIETAALVIYLAISDHLEVALRTVGDYAGKAADALGNFAEAHPRVVAFVAAIVALAAAVGPVLVIVGALIVAVGAVASGLASLIALAGGVAPLIAIAAAAFVAVSIAGAALGVVFTTLVAYGTLLEKAWSSDFGSIRTTTMQVWGEVKSFILEQTKVIVDWTRQNWPEIQKAITTVMSAVKAVVVPVISAIANFWTMHHDKIVAVTRIAWTAVKVVVGTLVMNLLEMIKLVAQLINGNWSGAWNTAVGILQRSAKAIGVVLDSIAMVAWTAMVGLLKVFAALAVQFYDAGRTLGTRVRDGLVAGIKSGAKSVWNAGMEMAKVVTSGASLALKVQSPSRVFYEIGVNVAKGLVLGLKDSEPILLSTIDDMMKRFTMRARRVGDGALTGGMDAIREALGAARTYLNDLAGGTTEVEKINALLADPKVSALIDARTAALLRQVAAFRDLNRAAEGADRPRVVNPHVIEGRERVVNPGALDAFKGMAGDLESKLAPAATTERQRVEVALLTNAYKDLTEAQKMEVRGLADQVDAMTAVQNETDRTRAGVEQLHGALMDIASRSLDELAQGHFKGFFSEILSGFKHLFLDIVKEYALSKLSGVLKGLLGMGNPNTSSGGGILDGIKGIFGGQGGGIQASVGGSGGSGGGGIMGSIRGLFGGGGSGGGGGLLSKIPGIGSLFGGGAAASGAASAASGLATAAPSALTAVGGLASGASAFAAPSALAALGVGGAGAGAAAGAGGAAAGAGAGGASGFGALMPLLTNPWTAVAVGAAVGGLLLWRHFRNGTEKKLRKAINSKYGVDIKDNKVLSQIKQMGEQTYGKGNVGKHIDEIVAMEPVRELIQEYGASTGQDTKGVVTDKQAQDPNFAGNKFVRSFAPASPAGTSGSGGGGGGIMGGGSGASSTDQLLQANMDLMQMMHEKIVNMRPGDVLSMGMEEKPRAVVDGFNKGLDQSPQSARDISYKMGNR